MFLLGATAATRAEGESTTVGSKPLRPPGAKMPIFAPAKAKMAILGAKMRVFAPPRRSGESVRQQRVQPEGEIAFSVQVCKGISEKGLFAVFIKVGMEEDIDERLQTLIGNLRVLHQI